MENEIVQASISIERKREAKKRAFDDILYLLMGDATPIDAIILVLTMVFFGTAPVLLILLFANYSGGMRWLLSLAIVTAIGVLAVYLMKRGTRKRRSFEEKKNVQTEFPGQLTEVTDLVERGASGYVYSQQMVRERLCENIINKLALARNLSADEIVAKLEKEDTEFIGDEIIAIFLLKNRRGGTGWEESLAGQGKSAERGRKFMMETEVMLDRIEEIV